jgi:hypothetical protein
MSKKTKDVIIPMCLWCGELMSLRLTRDLPEDNHGAALECLNADCIHPHFVKEGYRDEHAAAAGIVKEYNKYKQRKSK